MEGFGNSRRGPGSEDFASLLEASLREPAQQKPGAEEEQPDEPRVVNGSLDFFAYTKEQLKSVEGIEPGVFIRGIDVPYPSDVRTSFSDKYFFPNGTYYDGFEINGRRLVVDKSKEPRLPTIRGKNDFEVTAIDDECIYLSVLDQERFDGVSVETLEIENGEVDFFSYAGGAEQSYNIPALKLETKLNKVFIYPDLIEISTDRLPLKINGRNVRLAAYSSRPNEADFQDLVVRGITNEDIFVDYTESDVERIDAGGFSESTKFEVGAVVEDVVFEQKEDGRFIASNPDGKAFILDTASDFSYAEIASGFPVKVRIVRDTKPGNRDGFYVVEFVTSEEADQKSLSGENSLVYEVKDSVVSIPELEKSRGNVRSFGGDEDIQNFEVSGLKEGTVLTNVFLTKRDPLDIFNQQAFRLNDKSVYVEGIEESIEDGVFNEGVYDVRVVRNNPKDTFIDVDVVSQKQSSENSSLDRQALSDSEQESNYENGEVIKDVSFEYRNGRYVSSNPNGKAFLLDEATYYPIKVAGRAPIDVKFLRDTKPGSVDGFYVVAFDEDSDPDRRVLRDGKVNFEGVYTPGQEIDVTVEGLKKGDVISNIQLNSLRRTGPIYGLRINGLQVYDETVGRVAPDEFPVDYRVSDININEANNYIDLVRVDREINQNTDEAKRTLELRDNKRDKIGTTEQVTVQERDLADEPLHEDFFKHQVSQFHTPSIQTALRQARVGIPEMSSGREVLARGREMRQMEREGERHRHFSALGAAVYREKGAYRSFNAGVDVAVQHSSSRMREWLQDWEGNEPPRMPLAVIGSGPHGATFLATYRMYESNHSPLVVDQREHIGGQFADAEEPVFRLNSRNRPQMEGANREERNLPGGEQTINPLGTMATLQVSDLSGEAYVTQDVLSYATRFNTITSAKDFLTECRLIATRHIRREDGSEVERCTFLDEEESKTYTVDFDELVIAGGIGKDVFNFKGTDGLTQQFIDMQESKLERGERPTVMSFPQMVGWFGNPANKSPLKGVKEVVVSGSGDSANVAVGLLLGYEPGADRMPVSIDRVEKVYWVGQDIPSKEEWLKNIRTRYAQVGLEFPREKVESYYSRIVPVEGKVDDVGLAFSGSSDDKVAVYREDKPGLVADMYIACNGFRNDLPGVLAANTLVERKVFDLFSGRFDNEIDKFVPGMVIEKRGGSLEVQILGTNGNSIEYLVKEDGEARVRTDEADVFSEYINNRFSLQDTLFVPEKGTSYEELFDEIGFAVGKRVKGTNVTLVGPVSQLSISEKERRTAPVLEQIPENTAALFRYGRGTEKVARMVAKRLSDAPAQRYDYAPEKKPMVLQKGGDSIGTGPVGKFVNLQQNPKEVPYHVPHMEALKTALADHLSQLQFPSNLSEVRLSISMIPYLAPGQGQRFSYGLAGLQVANSEGRESDNKIRNWLEEVAKDDIFATAVTHEAKDHIRKITGRDKLRISEVKRKVSELEELTGGGVPAIEAENTRRINLELTVPIRGSRAEAMQLKHEWVDVL